MTTAQQSPWIVEQHWDITYQHTADEAAATFFRALRDEGKLIGIRCPVCERVLAPPRPLCDRDFCATEGYVELGLAGTLELFTVMHLAIDGLPEPPYVLAYVRPDGADTALPGFLEGVDLAREDGGLGQLEIGSRVEIALRPQRSGRITDLYFRLP